MTMRRCQIKRFLIISLVLTCLARGSLAEAETPAGRLTIVTDPRLELLAVVQFLSGYGERYHLLTSLDLPYKKDVSRHFSRYRDHPAVKLFAEMSGTGFTFDAPPAAMLHLSPPPELVLLTPFSDYLEKRAGGGRRLEQFVSRLRDLARQAGFMPFYKSHEGFYQKLAAEAGAKQRGADVIGPLEAYFGKKQHSYTVIIVPLFVGGYGPRIERRDGTYDVYEILGPQEVAFDSQEGFTRLAWHEFGHSFVNPLTEKFKTEIDKYSTLYKPLVSWMMPQAYGDWLTCVNEHVIRAVTIRMAYRDAAEGKGRDAAERLLRDEILREKRRGFFYVEALCRRLERYEADRDKLPDLEHFYPELIAVFRGLSEAKLGADFYSLPFAGPINAVFSDRKAVVLIVPTGEDDDAAQDKIRAYVKSIRDSLFQDSFILSDIEALGSDLSRNAIAVYGTVKGNLWLKKYMDKIPIKVEPGAITADRAYTGEHLRLITAWPNPQNPERGMVIYTAPQAGDIVGINSVFHGPTDYVIAGGTRVLIAADFLKSGSRWTLK
jgi:hypothetical protein